jgi:hypothetical protein
MAGVSACSRKDEPIAAVPGTQIAVPAAAVGGQMPSRGKILQLQQAAGYTYAEVDLGDGQKVWMAGGPLDAKVGDVVQWGKASVMENFTAKSLGRTFNTILFVGSWGKDGAPMAQVAPHGQKMNGMAPAIDSAMLAPPAGKPLQAGGNNSGQVKSVAQAGDYTYLEITQANGSIWLAAPKTEFKAGDKVVWEGDMVMTNFQSKALNRSFDRIIFASRVNLAK